MPEILAHPTDHEFVLFTTVKAPRDLVWRAFTEAEHLNHWWGPSGIETRVVAFDLKPGGMFLYSMRPTPGEPLLWGKWTIRGLDAPQRLETLISFADATGRAIRHPGEPDWPLEVRTLATFTEHGSQTVIALTCSPFNANEREHDAFAAAHENLREGWQGALDQLTDYLTRRQS